MKHTAFKSAGIYGAASLLGVAFLPAGVSGVLIGKDDATAEFALDFQRVYDASLSVTKEMGTVSSAASEKGMIKSKIQSCNVTIKIEKTPEKKVKVIVSARQFFIPKAQIAGGVLLNIQKKLGK